MAARPRQPIGSAPWIAEERASALQISQSEVEEFTFSARNDVDWLNEHMAEIFSENQINVAEVFKTPGKLRGRTPKTARKKNAGDVRVPLSNIFSSTPKGAPNPFAIPNLAAQAHTPKLKIAEDKAPQLPPQHKTPAKEAQPRQIPASKVAVPASDSGYHGSQSQDAMDLDELAMETASAHDAGPKRTAAVKVTQALRLQDSPDMVQQPSPTQPTLEPSFHSAKEEQTVTAKVSSPVLPTPVAPVRQLPRQQPPSPAALRSPPITRKPVPSPSPSPVKSSPVKTSPLKTSPAKPIKAAAAQQAAAPPTAARDATDGPQPDEVRSPSDGSSPIRPVVRKSSMNFASLPAREPLASHKSLGGRLSRTSHIDQTRMSYYSRHTGGKSLGNTRRESMDDDQDEMDIDDEPTIQNAAEVQKSLAAHNKTYTQRLQDQISMLGKSQSQAPRPSKSLAHASQTGTLQHPQQVQHIAHAPEPQPSPPPKKQQQQQQQHLEKKHSVPAPGAFPDDDGDDWIEPPAAFAIISPRPAMPKSHSADVMEQIVGKETVGGSEFILPKQRHHEVAPSSPRSPKRAAPAIPERTTSVHSHHKSASVPLLPQVDSDTVSLKKTISVSNPALSVVSEDHTGGSGTPSKSPSRTFRDSPLKQVKNKLSSILKTSKGLLASSAAISAEGKSSLLSPSTSRLALLSGPSVESLAQKSIYGATAEPLYPDLTAHAMVDAQSPSRPESPSRSPSRRTRASTEREKREQKTKDKEAKETQRLAEQISKLEKAREKEREKARVFSEEQEKLALEKQLAAKKERELPPQPQSPVREPVRATRSSPRKAKAQLEAEGRAAAALPDNDDLEMTDAPVNMPPPSLPRSAASAQGNRSVKRPLKPTKETAAKTKQAPTVIRVNTTSSQHSQFHPSNSVLAATLQDTLAPQPPHQLKSKASSASLQAKPSLQSLKSSVSASGRPKALELAAKRKEQEEREAQRKRDARAEMEKKRVAAQEEERKQEERRRVEAQKQREKERDDAEARKRQAAIERAKQTRAPPPPHRSQPNGPPDHQNNQPRNDAGPSRPPSRLGSMMPRSQEEPSRPVNAVLSNAAKAGPKRPLQGDGGPDESSQSGPARNGPSYQSKEAKRMRMSDELDELDMGSSQPSQSNIKGPPVRPSGGFKKDAPAKSLFPSGYAAAPPPSATRDLFKATVTAQHNNQAKANHPLDMAQVSKGAIPFAANAAAAAASSTHKTPARPAGVPLGGAGGGKSAAKSAAKSSPRFVNGDAIELPDIQTDDEDSEDDGQVAVAPWADSPVLRRALMQQETMDPMHVFGPPAPLNMEEVFSKTKERWHSFRKRTSSANWSGADRLTEEDIRKDLMAREKMRREGGWSYELSKEMI